MKLPELPAGHRWVISRKTKIDDDWGGGSYRGLGIALQQQVTKKFGGVKWKNLAVRQLERKSKGDWVGGFYDQETLVQCAERLAKEIYDQRVKSLETLLEEESIIGVYEPHQNQALPN